jgi:hypothetical protein
VISTPLRNFAEADWLDTTNSPGEQTLQLASLNMWLKKGQA